MTCPAQPLRFDVGDVVGEQASLAATYYPARTGAKALGLLVCLPGGTYSRDYWDLRIPGHHGYSFADFATGNGYAVVTIDPLGTGESSQPARDFDFSDIAATLAQAVSELPSAIGIQAPAVAMAHSLGGYLAITQQALFSSFTALALLGCTNQHVAPLNLDPAFIARSATPRGRAELAREILAALQRPYFEGPREHLQSWFHLSDVPAGVVAADRVVATSMVPRVFGTAMIPGVVAEHAALIDVPVLIGYGAVDVSPDPRAEAAVYRSCPDITTLVVADSAHCHNMASSRHRLWRRLLGWAATVTLRS
ncbi:alpha/beta hydrolase [Mycobacterium paraseoulense]|uniref:Alpha/beta hydrolase n=1 Tax=Mycobacterium paraseoulense TaxID=590652 RepID=A0A1X0I9M9_9MYCO|nr:alpha/beta hydrolase [Mycobacterium paraseoulense]MCV7394409.1 alpha/beta hydrolase [Mycobacterium paraseoulense]ORB40289.1 alpha/beta hydrolase [Mycobacterium paraseoulense]BBZ74174.1 alpha/beta hydrolase [Mycobacterium paraseoulense]